MDIHFCNRFLFPHEYSDCLQKINHLCPIRAASFVSTVLYLLLVWCIIDPMTSPILLQISTDHEQLVDTCQLLTFYFAGVGYGMVIISGIVCVYYNIIITWTLYFLYMSFRAILPWSTCSNSWNSDNCYLHTENSTMGDNSTSFKWNVTALSSMAYNLTNGGNMTENELTNETAKQITPSEEFWQ